MDNDEDGDGGQHPSVRKTDEVGSQHSRNSATGSYRRYGGTEIEQYVDNRGADAAQKVKEKKPEVTQPVFHIVSEDPEKPHVSNEVKPATVEEHGRNKGKQHRAQGCGGRFGVIKKLGRNQPIVDKKGIESVPETQLVKEDHGVNRDQSNGNKREGFRGIAVT